MKVEIRPAGLRDLTYVAANAREVDRRELVDAGPESPAHAAAITWHCTQQAGGVMYAADIDGNPEVVFGATVQSILTPWLYAAWMWGSNKTPTAIPEIHRWGYTNRRWVREILGMGCTRLEARSAIYHTDAHRWLTHMGATRECDLPDWGRNRTKFVLFAWRASDFGESFDVRSIPARRTDARSGAGGGTDRRGEVGIGPEV